MRTILSIAFLFVALAGWTQNNLQFSQAKIVSGTETVPNGKVWKLNSFLPTQVYHSAFGANPRIYSVNINGIDRQVGHSGIGDSNSQFSSSMSFIELPLWLPAGTTINPVVSAGYIWGINIIEFNLVD